MGCLTGRARQRRWPTTASRWLCLGICAGMSCVRGEDVDSGARGIGPPLCVGSISKAADCMWPPSDGYLVSTGRGLAGRCPGGSRHGQHTVNIRLTSRSTDGQQTVNTRDVYCTFLLERQCRDSVCSGVLYIKRKNSFEWSRRALAFKKLQLSGMLTVMLTAC